MYGGVSGNLVIRMDRAVLFQANFAYDVNLGFCEMRHKIKMCDLCFFILRVPLSFTFLNREYHKYVVLLFKRW